jgi:ubiquinone/menaquinone biosynthesis C-methylase UbiE
MKDHTVPYDSHQLFTSTAPYYARYRAGYPPELFTYLADQLGLDGSREVLDLGTGPGDLAIPLSAHVRRVIAVDPDPGMLDEGRARAAERGVTNIDWRLGDSHHLDALHLSRIHLATFGRAFHWTDRDALLSALDTLIAPGGAVVVVGQPAPGDIEPPAWSEVIAEIRARYLGPRRRAGAGTYTHPHDSHQAVLSRAPFSRLDVVHWDRTLTRSLDSVIGLQYSYSYSSPAQLGEHKNAFERDLRQALTDVNPHGGFEERVRTQAIIATRP